jgi:ribosome-associated protein
VDAARFKRAERWRDGLVERGPEAMAEFLAEFPHADRERLAALVAAARAERDGGSAGGKRRELFRFVQQQV